MLRLIEAILKKHLDDAAREYEREVEFTVISNWDILWRYPDFAERRALAKELIMAIRGVDISTLRRIPTLEEAKKFLHDYGEFGQDKTWIEYLAQNLIKWLDRCQVEQGS